MRIKNFLILFYFLSSTIAFAQEELGYQIPRKELKELIDFDMAPTVLNNSKNTVLVLLSRPTYKTIAELSIKELRLAGLRVDPKRYIGSRTTYYNKVELISFSGFKKDNKLNLINKKSLSFWVDSKIYNHVETAHLFLILTIIDHI